MNKRRGKEYTRESRIIFKGKDHEELKKLHDHFLQFEKAGDIVEDKLKEILNQYFEWLNCKLIGLI